MCDVRARSIDKAASQSADHYPLLFIMSVLESRRSMAAPDAPGSSDWVEAEIARQLEQISVEDVSEEEEDEQECQVLTCSATPPVALVMVLVYIY